MNAPTAAAAGSRDDDSKELDGIDPLLAVQFSDRPRYDSWSGEARLALAVVEDAIRTVRMAAGVRTPRAHRLAAEAWAWIASGDTTQAFAFENLCDYLGLNAGWLRTGMRLAGYGLTPSAFETTPRAERSTLRVALRTAQRSRAR